MLFPAVLLSLSLKHVLLQLAGLSSYNKTKDILL
jgi:hypothetical protein